jgi:hypothetical protein
MAITINWSTKVISVPQADLTLVSGSIYELDVDWFRLQLKDIEDSEEGMGFPDTHRHNTAVTLSGVTYARTFEIINGYTVTFENGNYTVQCVGANHNIADVKNVNSVSLIIGNSAGLINGFNAEMEPGFTFAEALRIMAAVIAGKSSGGPGSPVFRDLADSKNRVIGTADSSGNRTAATYDGS